MGEAADRQQIEGRLRSFVNDGNRKTVEEYILVREQIDKVKIGTIGTCVIGLLALDIFLQDKQFEDATQDDLLKFERYLTDTYMGPGRKTTKKGIKKNTASLYMIHIKRFYKYVYNKQEYRKGRQFQKNIPYPDCITWFSPYRDHGRELPIDSILTEEQLLKLLDACENKRDQAIIAAAFYDSGLRLGEALALNVGNVGFDELGGYFILPKNGEGMKRGQRKVRLFILPSSTRYLKEFLNIHPFKDHPSCPLFYSRSNQHYPDLLRKINEGKANTVDFETIRVGAQSMCEHIKTIARKSGLDNITAHILRHNSATMASKLGFNEMELRIRYGWSPTSNMPSRYVHLASADLDDRIKIITGYKDPEEPEKGKLVPILCWNCDEENVPTNKFCSRCGGNLKPTKDEIMPTAVETGIQVKNLMKNEELKEKIMNMMAQEWEKLQEK